MSVIEVRDLVKEYEALTAVDGVSFTVEEGEVFALLGPNGAGKSTTVEILEGHRDRTSGDVAVLGHDPGRSSRAFRERIGIVLQESGVEKELTVVEVLDVYGSSYPRRRDLDEILELVGLTEKRDTRVTKLSGGQRRRIDMALGLIGDPDLLFLDEPTTGFDPSARRKAWEMVSGLRTLGKTILLTSHYMDEVQALADRVAVLVGGRIVAEGTPDDIGGRADAETRIRFTRPVDGGRVTELLGRLAGRVRAQGDDIEVVTTRPTADLQLLTGWAVERGIELHGLTVAQPTLEDVYLDLIGADEGVAP